MLVFFALVVSALGLLSAVGVYLFFCRPDIIQGAVGSMFDGVVDGIVALVESIFPNTD